MFAMPGLRGFALASSPGRGGVSCSEEGLFVGHVALLKCLPTVGYEQWTVRPIEIGRAQV